MWVSPFRYLRINGYLLLPAAFRSLSRLSSALSAKASTLRSYSLNLSRYLYHFTLCIALQVRVFWFSDQLLLISFLILFLYRFDMFSHISSDVLNNFRCFSMCSFQGTAF